MHIFAAPISTKSLLVIINYSECVRIKSEYGVNCDSDVHTYARNEWTMITIVIDKSRLVDLSKCNSFV